MACPFCSFVICSRSTHKPLLLDDHLDGTLLLCCFASCLRQRKMLIREGETCRGGYTLGAWWDGGESRVHDVNAAHHGRGTTSVDPCRRHG